MQIVGDYERISDYSINITECLQTLFEDNASFSPTALKEIRVICDAVDEILLQSVTALINNNSASCRGIEPLEEIIDNIEETLKERHIERLKNNKCSISAGFPFVELLSHLERIADHCSNVGMNIVVHTSNPDKEAIDPHEYRRMLHLGMTDYYADLYSIFKEKYLDKVENGSGYDLEDQGLA